MDVTNINENILSFYCSVDIIYLWHSEEEDGYSSALLFVVGILQKNKG